MKSTSTIEYDFTSLAQQVDGSIPEEVAADIKHFPFSVGTSRSGTSSVQRLLNIHPDLIVSDEMGIFQALRRNKNMNSKKQVAEKIFGYVPNKIFFSTMSSPGFELNFLFFIQVCLFTFGKTPDWTGQGVPVVLEEQNHVVRGQKPTGESKWIFGHFDEFLIFY